MADKHADSMDREHFVRYLESQLIGPALEESDDISFSDRPSERYLLGALFPIGAGKRDSERAEDNSRIGMSDEEDNPLDLAYELRPSSIGLSFFVEADGIEVSLAASRYEIKEQRGREKPKNVGDSNGGSESSPPDRRSWVRDELASQSNPEIHNISPKRPIVERVLSSAARIFSVWRPMGDGYLVTVSLINLAESEKGGRFNAEDVLHQVWLRCAACNGSISGYPDANRYSWDPEEEELALLYRNKQTFAIGHGCAASWDTSCRERVASVETSFIPRYEVPPVTAELRSDDPLRNHRVFSLQFLADPDHEMSEKIADLTKFVDAYESWANADQQDNPPPEHLRAASARIQSRSEQARIRMRKGIELLKVDRKVQRCFCLANEAMLMQMARSHEINNSDPGSIGADLSGLLSDPGFEGFRWRPFQLAFIILVLESLANRDSDERDIVDLVWFPTGGGKTEAYLAAAAFELFFRRIKYGDAGGGTAVIKRYTLRLLTTQQFERAAALICACELLRRRDSSDLGEEPYTIGLWVGQPTSPNSFKKAYEKFKEMLGQDRPDNPFQLQRCPWCATRILPKVQADRERYGVSATATSFRFNCPSEDCEFHGELPVNVVDEHLYRYPPSLLIATIDKFARLAWTEEPRAFFHGGEEGGRLGPSLVIQDELHLISGPLGTIAGIYEAAMDVVLSRSGLRPKYVAATATIRRAAEQARRLYARPVDVFPPAGMSAEDSYFSREASTSHGKGRMYIGILGQYHTPVTALVHTMAAVAQAPVELDLSEDAADAYWTQVVFHNSRRELGKTMTLSRDDVPERVKVITSRKREARAELEPVEMSANIRSEDIPVVLQRLDSSRDSDQVVDILPCTNMFSVGVDVQRLGLILINGQPKTTAEYIQASSRVGRGKVPGLVIALYPNNKARDRSQYESFLPYHQALYRAVEPTSVTPTARPAMERAMHAAIVIAMRYCTHLAPNHAAAEFDTDDPEISKALDQLLARFFDAAESQKTTHTEIEDYFRACVEAWQSAASRTGSPLHYSSHGAENIRPLLQPYEPGLIAKPEIPWSTLNSMRNVDQECSVYVRGES